MFTGLIRGLGKIISLTSFGQGKNIFIKLGELSNTLYVGQSVAINGVCLTLTSLSGDTGCFQAVSETLSKSNLFFLQVGDLVNLEPALKLGDALDGHLVQGHVDGLVSLSSITRLADSYILKLSLPSELAPLVATKGSVALDGISLTVVLAGDDYFTVSVIPHSWSETTLSHRHVGDLLNLEVDVLARYISRRLSFSSSNTGTGLTTNFLSEYGFI